MSHLLELRRVVAGYGRGDILRGLTLELEEGSVTCIVGPNGAGKSTVLRLISGLLAPREGEVLFEGEPIVGLTPAALIQRGIIHVPQVDGLFSDMTVRENLLMGAYTLRKDSATIEKRYQNVERSFPMVAERANQIAGNLSGGQRRIVELARTMMVAPKLVLLDEPSAGLDPKMLALAAESIERLIEADLTVLLVEQNVRFGLSLAERGLVMESGRALAHDNADALLNNPELVDLFFGGVMHHDG